LSLFCPHPNRRTSSGIQICNGVEEGLSRREPVIYDGRHRYAAAVVRGDTTILVYFGGMDVPFRSRLAWQVISFLGGIIDTKPK
jgi:hypothetical protein